MPKFSQVFLADKTICRKICHAIDGENFDFITEIGPGGGALTEILYPIYSGRMAAVEIDRTLVPALSSKFPGLKIINADFMRTDIESELPSGRMAFIGNLPYDCSTAILDKVLSFQSLSCAVFMFQKEVAFRIMASVGTADYGILTVSSYLRAKAELVCVVRAGSFRPVPAVDSAVLKFHPKDIPCNMNKIDNILKKSFMHRRKTLVNSLVLCGMDKQKVIEALHKLDLPERARAQEINPETYIELAELIM